MANDDDERDDPAPPQTDGERCPECGGSGERDGRECPACGRLAVG